MDYRVHIARCVTESRGAVDVPPLRMVAINRRKEADPVGCRFETDILLHQFLGSMGRLKRISFIGQAMMEALEDQWPQFHRAVVGDKVLLTAGTTIYVTGRTRDGGETIAATWDYGESVLKAMGRIAQVRTLLEQLPDDVARRIFGNDWTPDLSPPQALVSDVIDEEDDPYTSLFGCGGAAPVSLAVGKVTTHLVVDHRLNDPVHFGPLMRAYKKHLGNLIQRHLRLAA